jgi:hypothetical protein
MLVDLNGLQNLDSVGWAYFQDLQITSLAGLGSLRTARENLGFESNPMLATLDGLDSLEQVKYLGIGNNPTLSDIGALHRLTTGSTAWKNSRSSAITWGSATTRA